MILKKLTAVGFKSFADKMELDFGSGITCIVGPNGCGKSNVVDAIKWVLGEQSAKSLRGKQMMDVIFNGSGGRKPANMVQVDLTFDNTDHTLPTDQTEVVVSRRLYRSGESEYLMNKQVCRLKDVRELFLDTGIGVDAYSVIEQGRVDSLLQANPLDRRTIFEEAAGINKYKARKKEAVRRLERVDQNLLRLQDIVDEVDKRLRSVKLAAGKARNYQTYAQRLRELRSRYALAEYCRHRDAGDALDREVAGLTDQSTQYRTDLAAAEARASEANVGIVDGDREITQTDGRLLTAQSQLAAGEERKTAATKRIEDQSALLDRSRERLAAFDEQMASIAARMTEQREAADAIEATLKTVRDESADRQSRDHTLATSLNDARRQLEEAKAGIIDLLRRGSQLNNEISSLDIHQNSLNAEKGKLDARDAAVAAELAEALAKQSDLQTRLANFEQLIREQTAQLDDTTTKLAAVAADRAKLLDQHAAAKEYRSGLESRRQLLEELDRTHEGLMAGARDILAKREADTTGTTFGYVRGALGELFETDMAHAGIVEAVLGETQQFLVADTRDALLGDREALAEVGGRIQSFCLDSVPPAIGGPDLTTQEGCIARVLDWVRYPAECERLARHLLGRTYAVASSDYARQLSTIDPGARFVTLDGVVFEPDGRIGVGALGSGPGMISRRSELRELARNLAEVDERIVYLKTQMERTLSEATTLEAQQKEVRDSLHKSQNDRVSVQAQLAGVDSSVKRLADERPLIASEVSIVVRRLEEARTRQAASREALTGIEQRSAESERVVEGLTTRITALEEERSTLIETITQLKVRIGELTQQRNASVEAIATLDASRIALEADRDKAMRDVQEAQERIEASRRQIEQVVGEIERLTAECAELTSRAAALRDQRDALRHEVENLGADMRRLRSEIESVDAQCHERQVKLHEERVRQEDLATRVAQELSVDLVAQAEGYVAEENQDWPAVEAEIEELRAKIERLGNVNLDAITEQEELEKRSEFLSTQLKDLRDSQAQLNELIERLNVESRERFIQTFAAVQEQFSGLFKRLFGGGKAELVLQDPNDVLECGIDIVARPPGKEPQSISLLSGGERTMTAIALLMAVFKSRPSPFVLMDEVDAALDEANNVRFNHVVQDFATGSQFIVITHSKRTMAIADVMYGITMQEAGVSKRVSVRFDDERPAESAA